MTGEIGPYKRAMANAEARANAVKVERDGLVMHAFPDYETYRDVQVAGNKAKLRMQFVKESHVAALSDHIRGELGEVSFGLCHGTRRGAEQAWFARHLGGGAHVLGTEISDTATQFANSVQWDFHDRNPEWDGRADFVYSNAWDHAMDPGRAFRTWAETLRPGGLLLVDHTKGHAPASASALDPVGATVEALTSFLADQLADLGHVVRILDRSRSKDYRARVVVWQRR